MEILMEHWLSVGVGGFLLAMVLYGHYRGFLKLAVTMTALVISLAVVQAAMPHISGILKENTGIHRAIGQGLLHMVGVDEEDEASQSEVPAVQREAIESLKLPEQMKKALLDNNNNEIYSLLGVDRFFDYLGAYLANMVINLVGSIVLFAAVFFFIRFFVIWLDLIARLPILSGINQIAGAVLGGMEGLVILWIAGLVITACSGMDWAQMVLAQIESSSWLSFIYKNNIFNWVFISILNSLI